MTSLSRQYSPATVQKVHNVLSLVLGMAVKDGRLSRNVVQGVNLPRVAKHEHLYLSHEQVEALANECGFPADPSRHATFDTRTNPMYRLVILFLAYTGVRFGEMAALRVARLDLRRNRAVIIESVTPVQGQGLVWGTTKTHQRREVPIPRFLAEELPPNTSRTSNRTPWSSPASGTANHYGSAPSARRSARQPKPSAYPTCTRTSSSTPRPASPSHPAPT